MKTFFIVLIALAFFTIYPSYIFSKDGRHLRTDGFYLYDNGIDTIAIIPGGRQMQMTIFQMAKERGLKFDSSLTKLDSEAKNSQGSTDIHFIAFLNDTSGLAWGTIYRKANVLEKFLKLYKAIQAGRDTVKRNSGQLISKIFFQSDSTITFQTGTTSDYFEEHEFGIVKKDSLLVKAYRSIAPGQLFSERSYIFIPFDKIPTDLLHTRKSK